MDVTGSTSPWTRVYATEEMTEFATEDSFTTPQTKCLKFEANEFTVLIVCGSVAVVIFVACFMLTYVLYRRYCKRKTPEAIEMDLKRGPSHRDIEDYPMDGLFVGGDRDSGVCMKVEISDGIENLAEQDDVEYL